MRSDQCGAARGAVKGAVEAEPAEPWLAIMAEPAEPHPGDMHRVPASAGNASKASKAEPLRRARDGGPETGHNGLLYSARACACALCCTLCDQSLEDNPAAFPLAAS